MTGNGAPMVADVRVTDTLADLVIVPRNRNDYHRLTLLMRQLLPSSRIRRTALGTSLDAGSAVQLAELAQSLELRWSPEAIRYVENRIRTKALHAALHGKVEAIKGGGRALAESFLVGGVSPVLDDHQVVNVAAMTLEEGYGLCVFDEQGAGKTVTSIFAFDRLVGANQADFALIVAPKSMISEWVGDFTRFRGNLYKVEVLTGTLREKRLALRQGADVLVTNFETVVSLEDDLKSLLRLHGDRAVLFVDESFLVKNLDARRTRAIRRLREWCGRAFMLCGTPAPNSPHDLVQQFNIVDFGLTFDGVDIPKDRELARPVVRQAIDHRGLFIRHLKQQVLPDLPAKTFERAIVPLQPVQSAAYSAALNDLVIDLRASDESSFNKHLTSFLARRMALLQICSNPAAIVNGYDEVPSKLLALDSLLDELIGNRREKVVLWSFFTSSIDAIMARYAKYNAVRYDGTITTVDERAEAKRKFQEDDETMLFVGNPAAAGAGITLHRARYAIYESMSNQAAHYLQSLDRIHRRGQTRRVQYVVLLCDRTIEMREYDRLIDKERSAQDLLGDQTTPAITRETMLADIEAAYQMLESVRQ